MNDSSFSKEINQNIINYLKEIIYNQNEKFFGLEQRLDKLSKQLDQLKDDIGKEKVRKRQSLAQRIQEDINSIDEPSEEIFRRKTHSMEKISSEPIDSSLISKDYQFQTQDEIRNVNSEEMLQEFANYHKKKTLVETKAIRTYLTKLERVINESWEKTLILFRDMQYLQFLDLGLTVLHGIIEYIYVTHFRKIPENTLDYYSKAKNIASAGVFKDLNLLERMETVFSDKQSKDKPVLAKTVILGWFERLDKIFMNWKDRVQSS
ncbi:MAG: hypothetical protein HeimC3_06280 [Candidatus Heimdallarchaeota archaeon LC_3]|nr:MAG: hypothetical protein HeimC3_06280 [Candidatus Heimdallarchaeota archaeon LC_3]